MTLNVSNPNGCKGHLDRLYYEGSITSQNSKPFPRASDKAVLQEDKLLRFLDHFALKPLLVTSENFRSAPPSLRLSESSFQS